jgi:hypothetical protein
MLFRTSGLQNKSIHELFYYPLLIFRRNSVQKWFIFHRIERIQNIDTHHIDFVSKRKNKRFLRASQVAMRVLSSGFPPNSLWYGLAQSTRALKYCVCFHYKCINYESLRL